MSSNGLTTQQTFDPATGQVQAISTGTAGNPVSIQHLAYQWDPVGNLTQRQDLNRALTESFTYDDLNRITQTVNGSNVVTQTLAYDAIGNIQQKTVSGVSTTYVYDLAGAIGPHAVTRTETASGVITASYQYDANGNLTNGGGRTVTWNAANYPVAISQANHTTAFTYGPDRQRVTQTETQSGNLISTTVSIGSLFEQTTAANGDITYRHFIRAGSQTIAIHTRTSDYTQTTTWLHRDHLGSISAITDEDGDVLTAPDGTVIGYYSYDAWGNRRNPETWQGSATNPVPNETDRGYTGHKMLDAVGLIHMGGRVYDPGIGRFLSADPNIPHPYNSQSYNRYSYVLNNPLSLVDPSGFAEESTDPKSCETDSDCDGTVNPIEQQRAQEQCYQQTGESCQTIDNGNGTFITLPISEVNQYIRDTVQTRILSMDTNNDGIISNAEFEIGLSDMRAFSDEWDEDGDSIVLPNLGWDFAGLLALEPSFSASGMAALGFGFLAQKGLYESDSALGFITPAYGLTASGDINIFTITYRGSDKTSPLSVSFGLSAEYHEIFGGRITFQYTPPDTYQLSVDFGVGAGYGFYIYSINKAFQED